MTATVATPSTTERDALMADLEDLWRRLDQILDDPATAAVPPLSREGVAMSG